MLHIKLKYTLDSDVFEITTDVKEDKVLEVLSEYVRTQMGLGRDTRKANELPVYEIDIGLDLEDDSFHVTANTGNDALTVGIVMKYIRVNSK